MFRFAPGVHTRAGSADLKATYMYGCFEASHKRTFYLEVDVEGEGLLADFLLYLLLLLH